MIAGNSCRIDVIRFSGIFGKLNVIGVGHAYFSCPAFRKMNIMMSWIDNTNGGTQKDIILLISTKDKT